jgi:hypothetical protein
MIAALMIKVRYHVFVEKFVSLFFIHIIEKVMYGERTGTCVGQSDGSVK